MIRLLRHRRFLRSALLAVLVLGMVLKPTLVMLGDLHGAQHSLAGTVHGAHGHDHGHHDGSEPGAAGSDPHPGDRAAPDGHALGSHGLLHQETTLSLSLPESLIRIPMPVPARETLPASGDFGRPGAPPEMPFRPPIS